MHVFILQYNVLLCADQVTSHRYNLRYNYRLQPDYDCRLRPANATSEVKTLVDVLKRQINMAWIRTK
jgi:hypothetical protein